MGLLASKGPAEGEFREICPTPFPATFAKLVRFNLHTERETTCRLKKWRGHMPVEDPSEVLQAGAIAFRKGRDVLEVVLVRPSSDLKEWLLPKGHIEAGEGAAQAAQRE